MPIDDTLIGTISPLTEFTAFVSSLTSRVQRALDGLEIYSFNGCRPKLDQLYSQLTAEEKERYKPDFSQAQACLELVLPFQSFLNNAEWVKRRNHRRTEFNEVYGCSFDSDLGELNKLYFELDPYVQDCLNPVYQSCLSQHND